MNLNKNRQGRILAIVLFGQVFMMRIMGVCSAAQIEVQISCSGTNLKVINIR